MDNGGGENLKNVANIYAQWRPHSHCRAHLGAGDDLLHVAPGGGDFLPGAPQPLDAPAAKLLEALSLAATATAAAIRVIGSGGVLATPAPFRASHSTSLSRTETLLVGRVTCCVPLAKGMRWPWSDLRRGLKNLAEGEGESPRLVVDCCELRRLPNDWESLPWI